MQTFASFLVEFHQTCGFNREVDLFVSQAVLQVILPEMFKFDAVVATVQILCQKRSRIASGLLQYYAIRHPAINASPPYSFPLLNFIWLLTLCVELRKVTDIASGNSPY